MRDERIMIVECSGPTVSPVEDMLSDLGFRHIDTAWDTESASALLASGSYSLVLADIQLPGPKDGIDLVCELKEKRDMLVIFMGNGDSKSLSKAKAVLPAGYLVKPVREKDLKAQVELALYREKVRQSEWREQELVANLYTGNCSGLAITLNLDGTIASVSPHIFKLTGRHSHHFLNRKLSTAGFERSFYELLSELLHKAGHTDQRSFYGHVLSPFIGQRTVSIQAFANGFFSYQFVFTDVTDELYTRAEGTNINEVSLVSNNADILNGFKSICGFVKDIRVAARMDNAGDLECFLRTASPGILLLDVNVAGVESAIQGVPEAERFKKLLLASTTEQGRMAQFDLALYDGYLSKSASDATLLEALESMRQGKPFYDPAFRKKPLQLT